MITKLNHVSVFVLDQDSAYDYEELKAKGNFSKIPTQEFYGFEALFTDESGNWFSLKQAETE